MLNYSNLNNSSDFVYLIGMKHIRCDENTTILFLKGQKSIISAVFITKLWR